MKARNRFENDFGMVRFQGVPNPLSSPRRQPVAHSRILMGQGGPGNRLLGIPLLYILFRKELPIFLPKNPSTGFPMTPADLALQPQTGPRNDRYFFNNPPQDIAGTGLKAEIVLGGQGWPISVVNALLEIARDPSSEELEDIAFIDTFLVPPDTLWPAPGVAAVSAPMTALQGPLTGWEGRPGIPPTDIDPATLAPMGMTQALVGISALQGGLAALGAKSGIGTMFLPDFCSSAGPFYCPDAADVPPVPDFPEKFCAAWSAGGDYPAGNLYSKRISYWTIPVWEPWSATKALVPNILATEQAMTDYPWPTFFIDREHWIGLDWLCWMTDTMRTMVRSGEDVDEDAARFTITAWIMANFNDIQSHIESEFEKSAQKDRFQQIIKAVGIAGVGAILTAGIGSIAGLSSTTASTIGKGVTGIMANISKKQQEEASKSLAEAAAALQAADPAFADEVQRTADIMKCINEQGNSLMSLPIKEQLKVCADAASSSGILGVSAPVGLAILGLGGLAAAYFLGAFD